jgi:hypothetical protein
MASHGESDEADATALDICHASCFCSRIYLIARMEGEPVRYDPVVLDDQAVQVAFLPFDEVTRGHCAETGLRHALQMQLVQDQKSTSFLDAFIEFSHHLH